jgi:hypothetical protein
MVGRGGVKALLFPTVLLESIDLPDVLTTKRVIGIKTVMPQCRIRNFPALPEDHATFVVNYESG